MNEIKTNKSPTSLMYGCGLTHFLCHFLELGYPALTLFIADDLDIPVADVLYAGFPLYFCMGIFAFPWGIISDRYGSFFSLGIASIIASLGCLGLIFVHEPFSILVSLSIIGLGIAAYHPAGMAAISSTFTERRGKALALHGIWGGLGILSAPILAGLIGYYLHWRSFYIFASLVSFLLGVLCLRIQSKIGSQQKNLQDSPEVREQNFNTFAKSLIATFRYREFLLLLICMTIAGAVYRANIVTLPILLKNHSGEPLNLLASFISQTFTGAKLGNPLDAGSSLLMGLAVLGGLIGQKFAGQLADKYNLAKCYFYFFLISVPCLILMGQLGGAPLIFISIIYFFFSLGMQPIENSLVAEISPKEILSSVYGIKFLFCFGIAALVVHPVSYLVDKQLYSYLYSALALALVVHVLIVSTFKLFRAK